MAFHRAAVVRDSMPKMPCPAFCVAGNSDRIYPLGSLKTYLLSIAVCSCKSAHAARASAHAPALRSLLVLVGPSQTLFRGVHSSGSVLKNALSRDKNRSFEKPFSLMILV